jgi:hypothetical protein
MKESTRAWAFKRNALLPTYFVLFGTLAIAAMLPLPGPISGLSPVMDALAQEEPPPGKACDRDGDHWVKDTRSCINKYGTDNLDCDDSNPDVPNPDGCPLPSGGETFQIKVRFGDESDNNVGLPLGDKGALLYLNDIGYRCCAENSTQPCSTKVCDFLGEVDVSDLDNTEAFGIAPALFNLLRLTEIRRTLIEPWKCFDTEYEDGSDPLNIPPPLPPADLDRKPPGYYEEPGLTEDVVYEFDLRSPVGEGKWWAKVRARSSDMTMEDVQRYGFHYGGECERANNVCPPLDAMTDPSTTYVFDRGFTSAVFGTGTNKQGEPQTCRCTVSSTPSCPDNVDMGELPRPAGAIFVKRITP